MVLMIQYSDLACPLNLRLDSNLVSRNLIGVEKRVTWEDVLDLRPGAGRALDYEYRMNLDG